MTVQIIIISPTLLLRRVPGSNVSNMEVPGMGRSLMKRERHYRSEISKSVCTADSDTPSLG